jgi:hypothetical protein
MAAVAPVGHRELLKELQPALVLAFVTTLSVVALPFVQQAAERAATLAECPEGEERADVIKTTLSSATRWPSSAIISSICSFFMRHITTRSSSRCRNG